MPGILSVGDFVKETKACPSSSNFISRIPQCKETMNKLEESIAMDKEVLVKLKNLAKDISKSGNNYVSGEQELAKVLNRIGEAVLSKQEGGEQSEKDEMGYAFQSFAAITKELSNQMKKLIQNLDTMILLPVDSLLKTEMRGSKGDLKRPFDRAWKDYQDKLSEIERQKRKLAKETGNHNHIPIEMADELEKERKCLQLCMTEYLMRVNEIKMKKNVDLLQKLLAYHHAQHNYFSEGLASINQFGGFIDELSANLSKIRQRQNEEKKSLMDIRNSLKNSPGFCKVNNCSTNGLYTLHQAKGDASVGNRRNGYLNKRSEGRLRNVWQKRRCKVADGVLDISHADETKTPSRVNLLTCQMKPVLEDRLCFDVVSFNRTYHFQAESEAEKEEWMSVLLNSKDAAMTQVFQDNGQSSNANQGYVELQRTLVAFIRGLPGNDKCCDCGSTNDPTWLSTNFGIIVCIECSGIHREMGVHISKIQSLTLDNIGTSQLLLARYMSNEAFNKIMEANRVITKIKPNSTMDDRKSYIKEKYIHKKMAHSFCSNSMEVFSELEQSISAHNIFDLIQAAAEAAQKGIDLSDSSPFSEISESSLHLAISNETGNSLHIVDFLIQNSSSLNRQTLEGNTPLHYSVIQNQTESLRLLLRSGANTNIENKNGKTALDIARERGHHLCEEMLLNAYKQPKAIFDNVNIDWHLRQEDGSTDFSDDETLEEHPKSPLNVNNVSSPQSHTAGRTGARIQLFTNNNLTSPPINSKTLNYPKNLEWSSRTSTDDFSTSSSPYNSSNTTNTVNNMPPPPPPPQTKRSTLFSGSNLAVHMVGSLKKGGSKQMSGGQSASNGYQTLPASHHSSRSSSRFINNSASKSSSNNNHKRSPSSDSGNGTLHNPAYGSRSTTPVSYSMGVMHHHKSSSSCCDNSPPSLQCFTEESSPENGEHISTPPATTSLMNGRRSTGSLESLSDESGGNTRPEGHVKLTSNSATPRTHISNNIDLLRSKCRCRALYDCDADNDDELTFEEGDIIAIVNEDTEDDNWMEGVLVSDPTKRGLFPVSFVSMLTPRT